MMRSFLGLAPAIVNLNAPNSNRSAFWLVAFLLALTCAAFLARRASKTESPQKEFVLGRAASESVIAAKKITVVDPAETAARRQIELAKVPAIYRFQQNAAEETVARFSAEFLSSRKEFLEAIEKAFQKQTLRTNQVAGPRFRAVFKTFKATHKTFPVTIGQALKWAEGNAQEELQKQFRERLRAAACQYIRSDEEISAPRTGSLRVLDAGAKGSSSELFTRSHLLRRTNLIGLAKARNQLATSFSRNDRVVSDVLTNFLQVNCVFDAGLTAQLRADRTNSIWAVATYEPGQVIVRQGQVIDAKTLAALEQLGAPRKQSPSQPWLQIIAVLCAALALFAGVRFIAGRRKNAVAAIGNVVALPMNQIEAVQAQLMPHLARGLMNKLVRALISQRADLVKAQHSGAQQLNELEGQLVQISNKLERRQAAYEQRIAELERELALAEEENREFIRARIREARQNLELSKAQGE